MAELQEELALDACPLFPSEINKYFSNLTVESLQKVESSLKTNECISLVLLLYSTESALDYIKNNVVGKQKTKNHDLLSAWAITESPTWRHKVLEALHLIQNYKILKQLGFPKQYVREAFEHKTYLDPVRKALFNICDNLNREMTADLLECISCDLKENDQDVLNNDRLEISFLWLMVKGYNLKNLNRHLELVEPNLQNILNDALARKVSGSTNCEAASDFCPDASNLKLPRFWKSKQTQKPHQKTWFSPIPDDDVTCFSEVGTDPNQYRLDTYPAGMCLIINQRNYQQAGDVKASNRVEASPDDRFGTDCDRDALCETFQMLGYTVEVEENPTAGMIDFVLAIQQLRLEMAKKMTKENLQNILKQWGKKEKDTDYENVVKRDLKEMFTNYLNTDDLQNNLKLVEYLTSDDCQGVGEMFKRELQMKKFLKNSGYSSFILCLLAHGQENGIILSDLTVVDTRDIYNHFTDAKRCPALVGKPKLFISQACRGEMNMERVEYDDWRTDGEQKPQQCDYIICNSTVPSYTSFRSRKIGTVFIQMLCLELQKNGHRDNFCDCLLRLNKKVSEQACGDYAMMPEHTHTFTQNVQFHRTESGFVRGVLDFLERIYFEDLLEDYIRLKCKN